MDELREPAAAHLDACIVEPLVLSVQRQVANELVDHKASQEAHVRMAALEPPAGAGALLIVPLSLFLKTLRTYFNTT